MLCCIIGALLIARFVVNLRQIKHFLGYEKADIRDRDGYGYED